MHILIKLNHNTLHIQFILWYQKSCIYLTLTQHGNWIKKCVRVQKLLNQLICYRTIKLSECKRSYLRIEILYYWYAEEILIVAIHVSKVWALCLTTVINEEWLTIIIYYFHHIHHESDTLYKQVIIYC